MSQSRHCECIIKVVGCHLGHLAHVLLHSDNVLILSDVGNAAIEASEDEISQPRSCAFGRLTLSVPVWWGVAEARGVTVTEFI